MFDRCHCQRGNPALTAVAHFSAAVFGVGLTRGCINPKLCTHREGMHAEPCSQRQRHGAQTGTVAQSITSCGGAFVVGFALVDLNPIMRYCMQRFGLYYSSTAVVLLSAGPLRIMPELLCPSTVVTSDLAGGQHHARRLAGTLPSAHVTHL